MTDEQNQPNVTDASGTEFKASPEALAAAASALESITNRSFSGRNSELGKMVNCRVCNRRHRKVDVVYREHFDENGKKTVTLLPLVRDCKQVFKQMWVDEDLETGELSIQYATVPLPGQKGTPKAILGATFFAKKRKKRRPSPVGLHLVEITRQLMPYVNKERFTTEEAQMLEARRMAVNTLRNRNEAEAKRIRRQQRESRRINRRAE
ncbi:MAG TPA: hypothetical protein VN843_24655 [Anaerolineales bacterium]|nr:hypothetical protein [Anaerolineales bacterium]